MIVIEISESNDGFFRKTIIEALEKVGHAKDLRGLLTIIAAASPKEVHRRVWSSAPSAKFSDGKDIYLRFMPIVLCMYVFSHN